jgi:hypothetical protein
MINKENFLLGLTLILPFGVLTLGVLASQPDSPTSLQKAVGLLQFLLILSIPIGVLVASRRFSEAPTVLHRSEPSEKAPNDLPSADGTSPLLV